MTRLQGVSRQETLELLDAMSSTSVRLVETYQVIVRFV